MKVQAIWKGQVLAESEKTEMVEGNHYFPPDSINKAYFEDSSRHTVCPWKGMASYYDIVVEGERNPGGAWFYPEPSKAASNIKNYVAFWQGVRVQVLNDQGEPQEGGFFRNLFN